MAAPSQNQPPAAPVIVPTPAPAAISAVRRGGEDMRHVTISPATTNKNIKFQGDSERFFNSSSLHDAFERQAAFKAVFPGNETSGRRSFKQEKQTGQIGRIVAVSQTLATVEADGKSPVGAAEPAAKGKACVLKEAPMGLISAIMTAYNQHCNLVISPDEVWLTILSQFCAYFNRNAEVLRSTIVAHEGQKELVVFSGGSLESADYQGMIRALLGEIRKNIKSPELADWFRPGFSTTTQRDEVCAAATAMASLQAYFTYTMCLCCGIPSVTLMGTVADWKLLREKIDRLLEFEVQDNPEGNVMELWVGYLRKVCDGFVESAEHPGSAKTLEFWDKVLSHRGGGSGPRYITGWVSAFTCFDKDGKFIGQNKSMSTPFFCVKDGKETLGTRRETLEFPLIKDSQICHNVVSCPVKIDDNGVEYDGTLFVGEVVFEAERDERESYPTVRPRNDWCMAVAVK